jgi:hypothetical protein
MHVHIRIFSQKPDPRPLDGCVAAGGGAEREGGGPVQEAPGHAELMCHHEPQSTLQHDDFVWPFIEKENDSLCVSMQEAQEEDEAVGALRDAAACGNQDKVCSRSALQMSIRLKSFVKSCKKQK